MRVPPAISGWILSGAAVVLAAGPVVAQSLRSVTNKKQGFKVKLPRFVKETPPQPDEDQVIAKYKGVQQLEPPPGMVVTDRKTKKRLKTYPVELEIWVFRISAPQKEAGPGPITPDRGSGGGAAKTAESPADAVRRSKNGGRTLKEFLGRRFPGLHFEEATPKPPLRDKDRNEFQVLVGPAGIGAIRPITGRPPTPGQDTNPPPKPVQCYAVEHTDEDYGHELFGMVWKSQRMDAFDKLVEPCVKSLRREPRPTTVYSKADPYEGSALRAIPKRREVRSRLVKDWYAEDTDNFILITDMTSNVSNRQLLQDMLLDLEIMRGEYEKRFPPLAPLDVVCTVRVCNSYDGYIRYSAKPGTGGYWHPINEELVLFNPVGKIKKQDWMRRVTPKAILYHEAMHQYFHYANGEMPPASWFNEGYGEYFGGAKTDRYQKKIASIGKNDFRWQVIKRAKKDGKWPLIEKILPMTQQVFYSRTSKDYPVLDNYAFAWAFCYFLEQERGKPDGNKEWAAIPDAYLANLRAATKEVAGKVDAKAKGALLRFVLPVQKRAFETTFGKTDFAKLQADWVAAMKSW